MKYAIIGAGPAGIEAASVLAAHGKEVTLFEKAPSPLKNIADKAFLFPNFAPADEMVQTLDKKLQNELITVLYDTEITDLSRVALTGTVESYGDYAATMPQSSFAIPSEWKLTDAKGHTYFANKVLVTTGYTPFDAHRKEELGYGIYKGIHTSIEMEKMIRHKQILNSIGDTPRRIVFLQCVGSRDEKSGNHYCSKVCCVTAVKQAIEVKKLLPNTEVFVFYMDLRMWGQGFEEMYRQSQETYGVRFVRGRISEASGTFDGRVQIKAEDTLMGLPMKMTTDLLVLMVGMEASEGTRQIGHSCNICGDYGFIHTIDPHLQDNLTSHKDLYAAGTCKRPMSLTDSVNDARAAALAMLDS